VANFLSKADLGVRMEEGGDESMEKMIAKAASVRAKGFIVRRKEKVDQ
jgi:hypothetical protein